MSFEQLEILLLLRGDRGREWTAGEVAPEVKLIAGIIEKNRQEPRR